MSDFKIGPLNHVGVAVPNIEQACETYRSLYGATDITTPFDMPEQGVKVCFVDTPGADGAMNGTQIELIEPLGANSTLASFLAKNPLGGQHHLCFEVPDIAEARSEFEALGKRILGPTRIGAHGTPIFFVHPKDMGGMLTEIMETPKEGTHWSN